MNTFNPIDGNFIIDGTNIGSSLSKQFFLQTSLSRKCKKKSTSTSPFEEFIFTPLTIWSNHFTVLLRFEKDMLNEIIFFWLDGDLAWRKEWEDIVKADFSGDFKSLSDLIEKELKTKPFEIKYNMKRWRFSWGEVQTWWEDKSYTEGIAFSWKT